MDKDFLKEISLIYPDPNIVKQIATDIRLWEVLLTPTKNMEVVRRSQRLLVEMLEYTGQSQPAYLLNR